MGSANLTAAESEEFQRMHFKARSNRASHYRFEQAFFALLERRGISPDTFKGMPVVIYCDPNRKTASFHGVGNPIPDDMRLELETEVFPVAKEEGYEPSFGEIVPEGKPAKDNAAYRFQTEQMNGGGDRTPL